MKILNKKFIVTLLLLTGFAGCKQGEKTTFFEEIKQGYTSEDLAEIWLDPEYPHIFTVAHRANLQAGSEIPENSILAIETAIKYGIDVLEIDLKETADGEIIVMHDRTVDRTTNSSGRIKNMSLEEIQQLLLINDAGATDQRVPTLDEVLELTKGKVLIYLDHAGPIMEKALEIVIQHNMLHQIIINSREKPEVVAERLQDFPAGEVNFMPVVNIKNYNDQELEELIIDFKELVGISSICLVFDEEEYHRVDENFIRSIRKYGLRVWVNTLWDGRLSGGLADEDLPDDPDQVWGELISKGFDIFQTDESALFRAFITSTHFQEKYYQVVD
ncbi:MAG: glycerophosphodiester phosphodiesterase family protein [Balneolaceae bacterium]